MRHLILFAVLLPLMACKEDVSSQKGKVSYAIGQQIGKSIKAQNIEVDSKVLALGVADAIEGKQSKLTDEEIMNAMKSLNEGRQQKQKAESDKAKTEGLSYLEKNKTKEGVKTTASGLQYRVITEGKGPSPKASDTVEVHYRGTLIDGTEFDSSIKRGQPAKFPLAGVIKGWTEGLQLMKKGSKFEFVIPSELAYGEQGNPSIPANSVLVFEVELLNISK